MCLPRLFNGNISFSFQNSLILWFYLQERTSHSVRRGHINRVVNVYNFKNLQYFIQLCPNSENVYGAGLEILPLGFNLSYHCSAVWILLLAVVVMSSTANLEMGWG